MIDDTQAREILIALGNSLKDRKSKIFSDGNRYLIKDLNSLFRYFKSKKLTKLKYYKKLVCSYRFNRTIYINKKYCLDNIYFPVEASVTDWDRSMYNLGIFIIYNIDYLIGDTSVVEDGFYDKLANRIGEVEVFYGEISGSKLGNIFIKLLEMIDGVYRPLSSSLSTDYFILWYMNLLLLTLITVMASYYVDDESSAILFAVFVVMVTAMAIKLFDNAIYHNLRYRVDSSLIRKFNAAIYLGRAYQAVVVVFTPQLLARINGVEVKSYLFFLQFDNLMYSFCFLMFMYYIHSWILIVTGYKESIVFWKESYLDNQKNGGFRKQKRLPRLYRARRTYQ
ncbi:hypothetical protein [Stomatohabitans albus]|uniref:hypothetical protein n=1 Tax=Stomatohabitans albus TaxID=3110766 RepID=UPI00300C3FFC